MNDNKPKPPKRRGGRPAWVMPSLEQVKSIAARVKYDEDVARCLGIRPETLSRKKKLYAQFDQAIKDGRAEAALLAGDKLMSWMLNGEQGPGPLFFYLERKCGWTKPSESEPPSVAAHRGLSSDLVSVLREALLGELRPSAADLIGQPPEPATTTTFTRIEDKRAELLGRNGHGRDGDSEE